MDGRTVAVGFTSSDGPATLSLVDHASQRNVFNLKTLVSGRRWVKHGFMSGTDPTMVRRQLGRRLRKLREGADITLKDVEAAKLASGPKLWRIESGKMGKTGMKEADVRALCWFYGADSETTENLATLARATNQREWWEEYADVIPDEHQLLFGLEAAASEIRSFASGIVSGLFQTPAYTMAMHEQFIAALEKDMSREASQRFARSRLDRQEKMLSPDSSLRILAIHDAATLARIVGSREIMEVQIERLCKLSQYDHIDIRVIPWEAGAHAAHGGQFSLMEFGNPDDPAVVFLESHVSARYLDRPHHVEIYRKLFKSLLEQSVPVEDYVKSPS